MLSLSQWRFGSLFPAIALLAVASAGCGQAPESAPAIPFSTSDATGAASTIVAAPTGIRGVHLLAPEEPDDQVALMQQAAREQAGQQKLLLTLETYSKEGPEALQEKVAGAGNKGAGVIILVPPLEWDPGARQKVIDAALAQGIKIVILARPVEGLSSSTEVKQVLLPSFSDQGEQLLAAALDKAAERPQFNIREGPALILVNPGTKGPWVQGREAGIREALQKRQIPVMSTLSVPAPGKEALDALKAVILSENPPKMILAVDIWTLKAVAAARRVLEKPESVIIAGFADDTTARDLLNQGSIDVYLEGNLFTVAFQAVSLAGAILEGRNAEELVELPTPTHRSDRLPSRGSSSRALTPQDPSVTP